MHPCDFSWSDPGRQPSAAHKWFLQALYNICRMHPFTPCWLCLWGQLGLKYFAQGHFSMLTTARKRVQKLVLFSWILPSTSSNRILHFFLGFLCSVLCGSHGSEDAWGIIPCVSDVDRGGLSAGVIRQIQYIWADWLLHCCHREHLVIAFRARTPAEFTELPASPVTCPCLCASQLEPLDMLNTPHIWPRSSFLYAVSLSENSSHGYTPSFNLKMSVRQHCHYFNSAFVLYTLRSCLSSSTRLYPKASASKCLDYSGIHLYNACDNGIKPLQWEKSVWRMDYAKALPMGRWTQELSQAVSISSGCIASENCSDTAFHVRTLFSRETTEDGQATVVCVSVSNYHGRPWKLGIYCSTSISNLHLLYIRFPHMAGVYLLFSCPWYRNTTELVCVFLLIAIMEQNEHFPCIQKQLPSIYTHFIGTCPQLEGHFRGLITPAALTLNIWGLDRRCVLLSPDPYLCPPQTMIPVCSCYSFSGTANFTLNNGSVVKHKHRCAVSDSLISVQERPDSHASQKPFHCLHQKSSCCFSCASLVYDKVTRGIFRFSMMWIVKFDIL